ncbi:MAG: hypothetical protein QNJ54_20315 [Prochloraceae cyanobacterium]|nr:hypothetical protein [Prochloraceae cyanobacterium]
MKLTDPPSSSTQQENRLKNLARNTTLVFASGCLGGMLNSLTVWFFGLVGVTSLLGVKIAPTLTPTWLYPRIVWGGLWGFVFLLPFFERNYFYRGILYSLLPSLVQLFIVFPFKANVGVMGTDLGRLTPLFVLFFNMVWGVSAAFWLKSIAQKTDN